MVTEVAARLDDSKLEDIVADVLNRWPSAGVAAAVVRDGELAWFHAHGVADTRRGTPVDEDTVFRIGSVTKTFTAVAVMQLWEQGLVDLDGPVSDYLRAFRLTTGQTSARAGDPPASADPYRRDRLLAPSL